MSLKAHGVSMLLASARGIVTQEQAETLLGLWLAPDMTKVLAAAKGTLSSEGDIRDKAIEIVDSVNGYTYNGDGQDTHVLQSYDFVEELLAQWLFGKKL